MEVKSIIKSSMKQLTQYWNSVTGHNSVLCLFVMRVFFIGQAGGVLFWRGGVKDVSAG